MRIYYHPQQLDLLKINFICANLSYAPVRPADQWLHWHQFLQQLFCDYQIEQVSNRKKAFQDYWILSTDQNQFLALSIARELISHRAIVHTSRIHTVAQSLLQSWKIFWQSQKWCTADFFDSKPPVHDVFGQIAFWQGSTQLDKDQIRHRFLNQISAPSQLA